MEKKKEIPCVQFSIAKDYCFVKNLKKKMFLNFLGKFNFNPHSEFFFLSSVSKILKKKILSKVIFDKLQFFRAFEYGLSNKTTSFEYSLVELVPLQAKTLLSTRIVKFDPTCVKVRLVRNHRMMLAYLFM